MNKKKTLHSQYCFKVRKCLSVTDIDLALVRTYVSEDTSTSIIRLTKIDELENR
jgi:hypothetical protein